MIRITEAKITLFSKGGEAETRMGGLRSSSIVWEQAIKKLAHQINRFLTYP